MAPPNLPQGEELNNYTTTLYFTKNQITILTKHSPLGGRWRGAYDTTKQPVQILRQQVSTYIYFKRRVVNH